MLKQVPPIPHIAPVWLSTHSQNCLDHYILLQLVVVKFSPHQIMLYPLSFRKLPLRSVIRGHNGAPRRSTFLGKPLDFLCFWCGLCWLTCFLQLYLPEMDWAVITTGMDYVLNLGTSCRTTLYELSVTFLHRAQQRPRGPERGSRPSFSVTGVRHTRSTNGFLKFKLSEHVHG